MLFPSFVICMCVIVACISSALASVENERVSIQFDPSGALFSILDKTTNVNVLGTAAGAVPLLDFTFVGESGELSLGPMQVLLFSQTDDLSVTLTWPGVDLFSLSNLSQSVASVDIHLAVSLDSATTTVASFVPSFTLVSASSPVSVWDVTVSVPSDIASDAQGHLFYPAGYGFTYPNPLVSTGGAHAKTYPCGEAAMQFMSLGNSRLPSGLYMGASDHTGSGKLLQFATANGHQRSTHGKATWRPEELHSVRSLKWKSSSSSSSHAHVESSHTLGAPQQQSQTTTPAALSIVIYAPDAGVPIAPTTTWTSPYPLTIGVVPKVNPSTGSPLWAQSAMIYRQWALEHADWTAQGNIRSPQRTASFPDWYIGTDLWLNTHWQCHDIFNRTGGEPNFVSTNTGPIADKIRATPAGTSTTPISLHWYEWQQGPNPDEKDRYLFDTHYPDYFPARTSFSDAVAQLKQSSGINTFPYINGRISDINSNAYIADEGEQYCTKYMQTPKRTVSKDAAMDGLIAYEETYGSNATFCVTNPFTSYWQDKIADTCEELVREHDVAGVYIDQIGSAVQKFCWDSSSVHNHTLGGGSWWVQGYQQMMDRVHAKSNGVNNDMRPMVTEDNAEPYLGMVEGLLSLNAFKAWYKSPNSDLDAKGTETSQELVSSSSSLLRGGAHIESARSTTVGPHVTPAYPFIYGGYYISFGAIWSRADFDDASYWAAKLATMLVTGTQLGWFSLAGRSDDPQDGCGPMGVGDLFLSPSHETELLFLQTASATRASVRDYFNLGHMTYPPVVSPSPRTLKYTSAFDGAYNEYSSLLWQAWTTTAADATTSAKKVCVVFAAVTDEPYEGFMSIDASLWFPNFFASSSSSPSTVTITTTRYGAGGVVLNSAKGSIKVQVDPAVVLKVPVSVSGRGTAVVEFTL